MEVACKDEETRQQRGLLPNRGGWSGGGNPGVGGISNRAPKPGGEIFRLRYLVSGSQRWRYSLSAKTSMRLSRPGRTEDRGRVTENRRGRPGCLYSAHPTSLKCVLARFPRGVGYDSQEKRTPRVSELIGRRNRCYPSIPVGFQEEPS